MKVDEKQQFKISMNFGKRYALHHISEGDESKPYVCEDATKNENDEKFHDFSNDN